MAAHGERVGELLRLRAFLANPDGSGFRMGERIAPWPRTALQAEDLGAKLAESLR
jgi:hypothetical protein